MQTCANASDGKEVDEKEGSNMPEIGSKTIVDRGESHWAKEAPAELGCDVVERLITAAERIAKAYEKLILATGGESC